MFYWFYYHWSYSRDYLTCGTQDKHAQMHLFADKHWHVKQCYLKSSFKFFFRLMNVKSLVTDNSFVDTFGSPEMLMRTGTCETPCLRRVSLFSALVLENWSQQRSLPPTSDTDTLRKSELPALYSCFHFLSLKVRIPVCLSSPLYKQQGTFSSLVNAWHVCLFSRYLSC